MVKPQRRYGFQESIMRFKKPKTKAARNIIKLASAAKTNPVKTTVKKRKDMSANLGSYLYRSKLPNAGTKIGASNVKLTTRKKLLKTRAQKGAHLNV
jgi:hypothetical protein